MNRLRPLDAANGGGTTKAHEPSSSERTRAFCCVLAHMSDRRTWITTTTETTTICGKASKCLLGLPGRASPTPWAGPIGFERRRKNNATHSYKRGRLPRRRTCARHGLDALITSTWWHQFPCYPRRLGHRAGGRRNRSRVNPTTAG